jgi:hypothetical protein
MRVSYEEEDTCVMCARPLVNHSEPSLDEPSGPFIDPPYAPRQQDPYGLSALPLLRCHQPRDLVWLPSTQPSRFR